MQVTVQVDAGNVLGAGENAEHMEHGEKPNFSPRVPLFDPCAFKWPEAREAHS